MNQRYYIEQMVTIIKNSIALFYKRTYRSADISRGEDSV